MPNSLIEGNKTSEMADRPHTAQMKWWIHQALGEVLLLEPKREVEDKLESLNVDAREVKLASLTAGRSY